MNEDMLLAQLREQTRPYHKELEEAPLLKKLVGTFDLNDYIEILKKFYGFYFPLETSKIPEVLNKNPGLDFFYKMKLSLLQSDLKDLLPNVVEFPICNSLPDLKSKFEWLGLFYTLEGSCLGRAFLWPRIEKRLSLKRGGAFFSNGESDLREKWALYCQKLEQLVQNESEKNELIQGSMATFNSLGNWFRT